MTSKSAEFICLLAATVMTTGVSAAGNVYYTAAVVELKPISGSNFTQKLKEMESEYGGYIQYAKKEQVDIIVFPEAGLYGSDYVMFHDIPDPRLQIVPAGNTSYDEVVQKLSSYAKEYSMYIAVNLLEKSTGTNNVSKKFNTNVVFDRTGAVVARYRKFNLYGELVDRTEKFEPSYFDSDFGVRFGQMIGLDILYQEPIQILMKQCNVTDFIYSSEWFSGLPFLTAPQVQWMFSVGNDVNLLASGLNRVERGSSGSGLFRGRNATLQDSFIFGDLSQEGIIIGNVSIGNTKTAKGGIRSKYDSGHRPFKLIRQNELDLMTNVNIELSGGNVSTNFVKQLCHGTLCCDFDLVVSHDNSPDLDVQYKAVVFDGNRTSNVSNAKLVQGIQVCGVVMCSNSSMSSCGPPAVNWTLPNIQTPQPEVIFNSVKISGNFTDRNSSVLPDVLLWPASSTSPGGDSQSEYLIDQETVTFTNNVADGSTSLSFQLNKKIISCGIFSRVFSRDANIKNSANKMSMVHILPLISLAFYVCSGVF